MDAKLVELYRCKSVEARWHKRAVRLDLPADVFSSFQLDEGTMFLLRRIEASGRRWGAALDLGCGYGPIALYLRVADLAGRVEGIDRDALAVAFAARNAALNDVADVDFRPGLAYDDVAERRYDLIVSNVPAKAGASVHRLMLHGASAYLNEGGEVWIVVVVPLAPAVDELLAHEAIEVLGKARRSGHVVYSYRFRAPIPVEADSYARGVHAFTCGEVRYELGAWHGLPEFDRLAPDTVLMAKAAGQRLRDSRVERLFVSDPGQGHLPIILSKQTDTLETITLHSRDLLALRCSEANLAACGFAGPVVRRLDITFDLGEAADRIDLIVARLEAGLPFELNAALLESWLTQRPDCPMIVGCGASIGARLEKKLARRGRRIRRTKSRGWCALCLG